MAGDDTDKKAPSIPSWQNPSQPPSSAAPSTEPDSDKTPALDTLEHARRFLDDESIKNATHERKVAFLESKGLKPEQIQDLLSPDTPNTEADANSDLKTVHDSTTTVEPSTLHFQPQPQQATLQNTITSEARVTPRTDIPPIITYPEFLLKPQKPPPLVTFERLANAAYTLAGLSALTYGASKYLVSPMLESLTDSRHSLAATTTTSLNTLNTKLESNVSRIPYIAPPNKQNDISDDTDSIDSDPTELFHRDIATQTSPALSRSSSSSSLTPPNATTSQTTRLTSLHTSLQSLLSSTTTTSNTESLSTSLSTLQSTIDKLSTSDSNYDFTSSTYSFQNPTASKTKAGSEGDSQAVKFKQEIRALKGAFLSSRNFPTVRAAVPFTLPPQQR